jgi:mannose-1-phosphate guanylyltransferase
MMTSGNSWAIVLAAGEGRRLWGLCTTPDGAIVPKQFCSLRGDRSLLADTIERAAAIVPRARILPVLAEQHRRFWEEDPLFVPRTHWIVQPENRGTAPGILLPLLVLLELDPDARIFVLPSDHYVRDELTLEISLHTALEQAREAPETLTLLGMTPDSAEPEFGWIESGVFEQRVRRVSRFVEKPTAEEALVLHERGLLWNSFILVGCASAFRDLFARHIPELLNAFESAFASTHVDRKRAIERLYERIEAFDFSRNILQNERERLRVLQVPKCGWTDLGTPHRVFECLRNHPLRDRPVVERGLTALNLSHSWEEHEAGLMPHATSP